MSYNWNTTAVAAGDNWQDHDIWVQHLAAIQERINTLFPLCTVGNGSTGTVAAGTEIQQATWWSYTDPFPFNFAAPFYRGMQSAIILMLSAWVDHRTVFEGYSPAFNGNYAAITWTLPTIRSAASLPTLYQEPPALSTFPANSGFRRKRPREAYTPDLDVQSNPSVVGQYRWDSDIMGTGLFLCTATGPGVWARQQISMTGGTGGTIGPMVDVLDNTLDYPNTVALDYYYSSAVFGSLALACYAGYSTMVEPGDYLGSWLFDEVRAITNLFRWQMVQLTTGHTFYSGSATSTVSYADALTQLATNWTAGGVAAPGYMGAYIDASYSSGTWSVSGVRWEVNFTIGTMTASVKEIDVYLYGGLYTTSPPATNTYDNKGDPVNDGSYHLVYTSSPTAATSMTIPTIGSAATVPPNAPPDPASSGNARKGYCATDAIAVMKFDCAGGFTYLF